MPDAPAPRAYSPQDRALQNEITAWERSLEAARDDAEVQAILGPVGFGPAALDGILALVSAAQDGYDARALAMGAEDDANAEKAALPETNRTAYAVFRDIARARFKGNDGALAALNLNGSIPDVFDGFMTHARPVYANATTVPYTEALTARGYTPDRCRKLEEDLDRLVDAAKNATEARDDAKRATRARNAAMKTARAAFAEFSDTARPLLAGGIGL